MPPTGDASTLFPQSGRGLRLRDPQRRQQAEHQTGDQGQPEDEARACGVERRRQRDRGSATSRSSPCAQRERHDESGESAGDREAQAFGEQLPDQPPAAAPSASRTAISRPRAVVRASSRLPRFAQAMSSTSARGAEQHPQRFREVAAQRRRAGRRRPQPQPLIQEAVPRLGVGHRP